MTKEDAKTIAATYDIPLGQLYHALHSDVVQRILDAAKAHKYRAPKNANGSTGRYFYYALTRAARRA